MLFLSTTIHGLEDIAAREIENFGARILELRSGKVIYEGNEELIYKLNYGAKRIFRIAVILSMGKIKELEDLRKFVQD